MKELIMISEHQNGTRNARVYLHHTNVFDVIVYDSDDDYTFLKKFGAVDDAEDYAENWVLRYGKSI